MDKKNKKENSKEKSLFNIFEHPLKVIEEYDEILDRKISQLGNSGHISIPSKHIGKQAKVYIKKNSKKEEADEKKEK